MLKKFISRCNIERTSLAFSTSTNSFFEHSFTNRLSFVKEQKKHKCFRVMDEEGEVVSDTYDESLLTPSLLQAIFL